MIQMNKIRQIDENIFWVAPNRSISYNVALSKKSKINICSIKNRGYCNRFDFRTKNKEIIFKNILTYCSAYRH